MIKKIYLSCILCIIIIIGISLTGCINEEEPEEQNVEEIAIQTVELLSKSEFNQAYEFFNETITDQLTVQQLEDIWDTLIAQYGEFDKATSTRIDREGGYDVVYVTCNFSTMGFLDIKMVFDGGKMISGFRFVPTETEYETPEYADLDIFEEVNVTVGIGEWELPGTLTLPKGEGPFPAVVLVHGSGPLVKLKLISPVNSVYIEVKKKPNANKANIPIPISVTATSFDSSNLPISIRPSRLNGCCSFMLISPYK